jgi:hypothetical protein
VVPAWEELDPIQDRYKSEAVAVDVGYGERTAEAYEEIAKRRSRRWFGVKGWDQMTVPIRATKTDPFVGKSRRKGAGSGIKITLLNVNQSVWKSDIAKARTGNLPGWRVYAEAETDAAYRREIFDEQPVAKKDKRGKRKTVWVSATGQNHCFDLECYQRALAYHLRWIGPRTIWTAAEQSAEEGLPGAAPPDPEGEVRSKRRYIPIAERAKAP